MTLSQNNVQQRFAVTKDLVEVFKIFSQFRVLRRFSEVEGLVDVLKALSQDTVQLRLVAVPHPSSS